MHFFYYIIFRASFLGVTFGLSPGNCGTGVQVCGFDGPLSTGSHTQRTLAVTAQPGGMEGAGETTGTPVCFNFFASRGNGDFCAAQWRGAYREVAAQGEGCSACEHMLALQREYHRHWSTKQRS